MAIKIYWQDVWPEEIPGLQLDIMWESLLRYGKMVLRPDTNFVIGHPDLSSIFLEHPYFEFLNNQRVVEGVIKATGGGYDGAMVGCIADPGVHEARSMVEIPVIGVGESSMIMGKLLGRKLAMVTIAPGFVNVLEKNIRFLGHEDSFIRNRPVRYFNMQTPDLLDAFEEKSGKLISSFEEVARSCVADGADCILVGCGWVGPAFTLSGYTEIVDLGVPVVDGTLSALKLIEALADLRQNGFWKKSKDPNNIYTTPPDKLIKNVRKRFGLEI